MKSPEIEGSVVLVTGSNRGIGRAITEALLERGAAKVYAGARNLDSLAELGERFKERLVPLELDVTDAAQVAASVEVAGDVQLLINNAGVAQGQDLTSADIVGQARIEMEVNYFAPLSLIQRYSSVLAANGGGAVVNVVSIGGLTNFPFYPTYSASKAAVHSLTQGARMLLAGQGTSVFGVYPGPVDTDMARGLDMDKESPAEVARAILDAIEGGNEDIFPDAFATSFGEQYEASPKTSERQVTAMLGGG